MVVFLDVGHRLLGVGLTQGSALQGLLAFDGASRRRRHRTVGCRALFNSGLFGLLFRKGRADGHARRRARQGRFFRGGLFGTLFLLGGGFLFGYLGRFLRSCLLFGALGILVGVALADFANAFAPKGVQSAAQAALPLLSHGKSLLSQEKSRLGRLCRKDRIR